MRSNVVPLGDHAAGKPSSYAALTAGGSVVQAARIACPNSGVAIYRRYLVYARRPWELKPLLHPHSLDHPRAHEVGAERLDIGGRRGAD
jgi:hypothetical protein